MKLPASIWIGGRRLKIVKCKKLIDGKDLGEVDWDKHRIKFFYPHQDIKNTILHECIHALEGHFHLDFKDSDVVRLATGLRMLFVDNPELISIFYE